jgi:hypothetical protein
MKALQYSLVVLALALSSCTVYKYSGTPDDVYYSPANQQPVAVVSSSSQENNGTTTTTSNTQDGGTYVTYDDGSSDNGYADNGISYSQQIQMFDNPNYYYDPFAFNNWYSPYYSPYLYNSYFGFTPGLSLSFGFGNYYPYYYGLNSFGLGLGYAYNPWYSFWNPYSYYYPYAYPYYGYAGLGFGEKYNYNLRPANTFAPRVSAASPTTVYRTGNYSGVDNSNYTRVFTTQSRSNPTTSASRVFVEPNNNGRIPVSNTGNVRTTTISNQPVYNRRVFTTSNRQPVNFNNNSRGSNNFRVYDNTNNNRSFQINNNNNNSFRQSAPAVRSNNFSGGGGGGGGAPARTFSPRGGRR